VTVGFYFPPQPGLIGGGLIFSSPPPAFLPPLLGLQVCFLFLFCIQCLLSGKEKKRSFLSLFPLSPSPPSEAGRTPPTCFFFPPPAAVAGNKPAVFRFFWFGGYRFLFFFSSGCYGFFFFFLPSRLRWSFFSPSPLHRDQRSPSLPTDGFFPLSGLHTSNLPPPSFFFPPPELG